MGKPIESFLQGAAVSAPLASGYLEGQAAKQQAASVAAASRYNAELERLRGREKAASIRQQGSAELTRQRVGFAAKSGLRLEGSPVEFLAANAAAIEKEAADAEVAAMQSARLDEQRARSAEKVARSQAGTSLLTGGLRAGAELYRLRYVGR